MAPRLRLPAALIGSLAVIVSLAAPIRIATESRDQLVVWNVGQGQWVTLIEGRTCWHFDAGGERAPWAAIRRACGRRLNRVTLSHWDLDHISFVGRLKQRLRNACLLLGPTGGANARKSSTIASLPPCRSAPPFERWVDDLAKTENDRSRVVWWRDTLIPGDAPRASERGWLDRFRDLRRTRILILGHHGSGSSTSPALLARLVGLRVAIASARSAKYGHPHARVRDALARARVPLLTTEDWNSIYFDLD